MKKFVDAIIRRLVIFLVILMIVAMVISIFYNSEYKKETIIINIIVVGVIATSIDFNKITAWEYRWYEKKSIKRKHKLLYVYRNLCRKALERADLHVDDDYIRLCRRKMYYCCKVGNDFYQFRIKAENLQEDLKLILGNCFTVFPITGRSYVFALEGGVIKRYIWRESIVSSNDFKGS